MELTDEILEEACRYHYSNWSSLDRDVVKRELRRTYEIAKETSSYASNTHPCIAYIAGALRVGNKTPLQSCDLSKVKHLVYAAALAQGHSPSAYWAETQVNQFGDIFVIIKRRLGDESEPKDIFEGRSRKNLDECYLQIRDKIEKWHATTTKNIMDDLDKCVKRETKDAQIK
jgi:hypothetical protein